MKDKRLTLSAQRAVADVLTAFLFVKDEKDFQNVWNEFYEIYDLRDDPFTYCPCAPKDYYENKLEYEKQIMLEKYGHCDGLE